MKGLTELAAAVIAGNLAEVEHLLEAGARTEQRTEEGLTPLMLAAGQGRADIVELLLKAGADLFCVDSRAGVSVLHKACQGGSIDVVKLLVKSGAFKDLPTATTGHTPLMDAIWYKWPEIVKYLVEEGAGLHLSTHYGFTLQQHIAFEEGVNFFDKERFAAVKEAVQQELASRERLANAHRLMNAVNVGDAAMVKHLLNEGVDVNERFPVMNGFNDRHTALHVACRDGRTAIVGLLLEANADVNMVEPVFGATPLHKAVYNGNARITAMLAASPGICLDVQGTTNGYTPLHDALWHGFADCALVLIRAGARLDLKGNDGLLPIDLARHVFGASNEVLTLIQPK